MVVLHRDRPVCAYCGNKGFPLQPHISRHDDYRITGYTCVCKDAMDSLDIEEQVEAMKVRHRKELEELLSKKPKENKDVVKAVARLAVNNLLEDIDKHNDKDALSALGIKFE